MLNDSIRWTAIREIEHDLIGLRGTATSTTALSPLASPGVARLIAPPGAAAVAPTAAEMQVSYAVGASMLKTGPLSHFDSQLAALYLEQSPDAARTIGFTSTVGQTDNALSTIGGKQYVTVDVTAKNGNGAALLDQLSAIGLHDGASFGSLASGRIAVDHLDDLLQLSNLGFARESGMVTRAGEVTSQAVPAQHTDIASATYGVDGSGIRVGVLSDSFDQRGGSDTMATNIASDDLPVDTQILFDDDRGSDEGRAMAQLVHDIAPGAAIDFATAFTGQANFARNILALAAAGDKIIVDDVGYFNELAYQNGPIAQAIEQVTSQGVMYFSSAGNDGNEGLEQRWRDGATTEIGGMSETLMRFDRGAQDYVTIDVAQSAYVLLQWDDPAASAGRHNPGADGDLDLFVTNEDGSVIETSSVANNIGGDPVELLRIDGHGTFYIRVGLASGEAPSEIKLLTFSNGGPVDLGTTSRNFNDGTVWGHPAAPGAIAVGAIAYYNTPAFGNALPKIDHYSSGGPTRLWFDDDGNRLPAPTDSPTPQISAVDGANTTFFGGDFDGDGFGNFFGTSAAAPNAAAVAALMLEARAGLTPDDVLNLLMDSCIDMNDPTTPGFDNGHDNTTGSGFIQADRAVGYAATLEISNDGQSDLEGTHFGDTITGSGMRNRLMGNDGDDTLIGGIGADVLEGGAGQDTFAYNAVWESTFVNWDRIADLQAGDSIDVSAIDANTLAGSDQAFTLVAAFDHNAGEAVLAFHATGRFAGQTTLALYTNADNVRDALIVMDGDHHDFANIVL